MAFKAFKRRCTNARTSEIIFRLIQSFNNINYHSDSPFGITQNDIFYKDITRDHVVEGQIGDSYLPINN